MFDKRCITCKGALACGLDYCPIYSQKSIFKIKDINSDEFFGATPPSVFVGSKLAYPKMNVGILNLPELDQNEIISQDWSTSTSFLESPRIWASQNISQEGLFQTRSSLVNSRFQTNAQDARSNFSLNKKFIEIAQLISMSSKPLDTEVQLNKKVKLSVNFDKVTLPSGPKAELKKITLTDNPKIPTYVDKVVSDSDLKAVDAIKILHSKGHEESDMSKLLSIGTLGLAKNRKFVSTRWSITAVDDIVGKSLIHQVKGYETIDKYEFYYATFFGNHYFILLMPRIWSYELFEGFLPGSIWNFTGKIEISTDYESYKGRTTYAEHCVGGYYAARLPILEYLIQRRRQAGVLIFRVETPEYKYPMGVWVCRETSRKSISSPPSIFEDLNSSLNFFRDYVMKILHYDLQDIFSKSLLIKETKTQKSLMSYF